MKFDSLQEYFYKLQTILFLLLLVPLLAFIILVSEVPPRHANVPLPAEKLIYTVGAFCFLALLINAVATLLFSSMIKRSAKKVGLSAKLDHYHSATLMRYSMGSMSCLIIVAGFFFTGHYIFTIMFGIAIVMFFITWPWPSKVCSDLKLKGDEKEMVLYKKHSL